MTFYLRPSFSMGYLVFHVIPSSLQVFTQGFSELSAGGGRGGGGGAVIGTFL